MNTNKPPILVGQQPTKTCFFLDYTTRLSLYKLSGGNILISIMPQLAAVRKNMLVVAKNMRNQDLWKLARKVEVPKVVVIREEFIF